MRAGNGGGQIDGHGDAQAPNDADFPLAEAGARQFQRGNAAYAKDQQRRAEELGDALTCRTGGLAHNVVVLQNGGCWFIGSVGYTSGLWAQFFISSNY